MDVLQGNSSVLEPKTVVEKILTTRHRLFAECPKHSAKPYYTRQMVPHTATAVTARQALPSAFFGHSAKLCGVPKCPRQNKVKTPAKCC